MKLKLKDIPESYPYRGAMLLSIPEKARKHILEEVNKRLESLEKNEGES